MARIIAQKKAFKNGVQKKIITLLAASATAVMAGCGFQRAFATVSMAPRSSDSSATVSKGLGAALLSFQPAAEAAYGSSDFELQLASGFPGAAGRDVGQGPQWATCFASVESATLSEDGIQQSTSLEQWIMRGEKQNTDSFKSWRERMAKGTDGPVNVRCVQTDLKSVEDVVCLECVSHVGGLPFLPQTPIVPSGFLVSDLQQCMRRSFDGTGFCKSASVVV